MIRARAGVSRPDLARATGRSPKMIERYENGKVEPPADVLVKMAAVLRVSVDELLNLPPPLPSEMEVNGQRYVREPAAPPSGAAATSTSSDPVASHDDELAERLVARDVDAGKREPQTRRSGRPSNG